MEREMVGGVGLPPFTIGSKRCVGKSVLVNEEDFSLGLFLLKKSPPVKENLVVNIGLQHPFLIDFSSNCVTINSIF
jgi:hypothetical protein